MTSGFHQMAVDIDLQHYLTFATEEGHYSWSRAPMGPTNVPPYFQQVLTTEVFPDFVNRILVIYMDDLLNWAKDFEELLERLRAILIRARKFNVTFNPKKSKFGLREVEYLGHLLSAEGLNFSEEKKKQFVNLDKPLTLGELKSMVGLASYFRDHIRSHAMIAAPLNEALGQYDKKKKNKIIEWNSEMDDAFEKIRNAIINCPTLSFHDPTAPIRLFTDASHYGIGAYLCQIVKQKELPVGFISKTLNKQEKKWHIYDKEAYSIYYALKKWDTLLRDNHFTLFTDHKNLTYLDKDPSARVQRWRMAVQQFSCDVAFLTTEENEIADHFSRLCPEELDAQQEILSIQEMNSDFYDITHELHILENVNKIRISENKYNVLSACHNTMVGHFGYDQTEGRVKQYLKHPPERANLKDVQDLKTTWSAADIRREVRIFIRQCPCCNKMQKIKLGIVTKKYTIKRYGLFQLIYMDSLKLPKSKQGNEYLLVIIDSFSRYIKIYIIKTLTAQEAADCLLDYICDFPTPEAIVTDNATQFQIKQ